jgi:hypothetical protein
MTALNKKGQCSLKRVDRCMRQTKRVGGPQISWCSCSWSEFGKGILVAAINQEESRLKREAQ